MKKLLFFFVCATMAVAASAAPENVDFTKMPKKSQEFVQKNFPKEKIKTVIMDREASWDKYTVNFSSGSTVSFNGGSGDWAKVQMKDASVPATIIPAKIKAYAANKYPDQKIVMIETTTDGYKIGLSNKATIDFDKDGTFLKAIE